MNHILIYKAPSVSYITCRSMNLKSAYSDSFEKTDKFRNYINWDHLNT